MTMPAFAPSTPASHEPSFVTGLPFSYSVVSSPRYQTLPCWSWAYQSSVSSTSFPFAGDAVVHDARGHAVGDPPGPRSR